jgi:Family of unknown function (DUF6166)
LALRRGIAIASRLGRGHLSSLVDDGGGRCSANRAGAGLEPDHGHGGPNVVGVIRDGQRSNLELRDERLVDAGFEWGYHGAGPRRLAQAILNDFLRFDVDLVVASALVRDVVARLPAEVELTRERVASWGLLLGRRRNRGGLGSCAWRGGRRGRAGCRCDRADGARCEVRGGCGG